MMAWFEPRRWLNKTFRPARSAGSVHKRARTPRLQIERLEDLNLLSTLDVTAGSLTYTASANIDNNLTIALVGSPATSYSVTDTGETITLTTNAMNAGWNGSGTNTVTGPIGSVFSNFTVNLLTGADALNVNGNINVFNQVALQSGQDVAFNGTGGIATVGNVSLTAGTGAISQTGTGTIVGANLAMQASTGIGDSAVPLSTAAGNLAAQTGTGGIFIANAPSGSATLNIADNGAGLNGIQVTGASGDISLSNNGSIDITSDGDVIRGPGDITVSALGSAADIVTGGQVNSGLAAIGVTAGNAGNVLVEAGRDIDAGGSGTMGSIRAESGDVTLTAGRDLTIDNGSGVGCAPSSLIPVAGKVTLQSVRDIVVDNGSAVGDAGPFTTMDGGLLVTAGRDITVDHGSALGNSLTTAVSTANIAVTAGNDIVVNNGSFVGDLSSSSLTVTAGMAGPGSISALATSVFNTNGGDINLTTGVGGTFTLSAGSAVDSTTLGGAIVISADDMALDFASSPASQISASNGGIVRLQQASTTARPIDLGSGASGGALNLSDGELGVITAGILRIGRLDNAGNITVTAPITAHSGYSVLSLFTGGGLAESSSAGIAVMQLEIHSVGTVALDQTNDVTQALAASVTGAGQGFAFTQGAADQLIIDSVEGLNGITTADGAIALATTGANLQVNQAINAGAAEVALTAGGTDSLLTIDAVINNAGVNLITLTADRMDLEATITNISTGRVTLQPASAARPIDLGSTLDPLGKLSLSNNELNEIQTSGVLQVGNDAAGSIVVSTEIFPASVLALALNTNIGITQAAAAHITAPELAVRSAGPVVLDQGNNIGQALSVSVTGTGQAFIFDQGFTTKLIIGNVDGLTGITTNGGAIFVSTANSELDVTGPINAGSALVSLTAGGAENLVSVTATINNSGNNPISLIADRMDLKAVITNINTGRVTLQSNTTGRPVDLGSTLDPVGKLSLSNNELNEIQTSGVLQVGTGAAGNIVVSATIFPASVLALSLQTGGGISQAAGTHITAPELALRSVNAIVLDQGNNIGQALAASATGTNQNITFIQGFTATLPIGNVDGLAGLADLNGSIALAASTIKLLANVTSGSNQTYTGPVTLGANVSVASAGNGNIVFANTVQSPGTAFSLNVNTGGLTMFSGAVGGGGNPLGGLTTGTTGFTQINGGAVASSTQTYGNTVTIGSSPTTLTGNATFNGNLILGNGASTATRTLQVTGNLIFSKSTTLTSTFAGTASSQFGHIVVSGGTTFTGATLSLNYLNFNPAPQNTFDVVGNGTTPTGQFANAASPGPVNLSGVFYAVSYAGGTSGKDFVLTTDMPPFFTSPSSALFTVNKAGTFTVTAAGFPTPTLKLTGTLPKGVTFNATTGVLSGTTAVFGFFPVSITATNSVTTATQNFTLIVSGIPNGAVTPNQRFISQVYIDLLGRVVDTAGLAAWTNQLNLGVSRPQIVLEIEQSPSNEYRTIEVQQLYQRYLHRKADPTGLANSIALLASTGGQVQQLAIALASSNEFLGNAGATNTGFLQALYQAALQRAIDPLSLAAESAGLANGAFTRAQLAQFVITSMEANQQTVQFVYTTFLHRAADPQGLAFNTQTLAQGATFEQLVAFVVGSQEFFQNDVGP